MPKKIQKKKKGKTAPQAQEVRRGKKVPEKKK